MLWAGRIEAARSFVHVRDWNLWTLPKPLVAYLLTVEVVVLGAMAWMVATAPTPAAVDWRGGLILLAAASVHLWFSRRSEESRRDQNPGPHVDTTVVWTFPAAVLLPAPFAFVVLAWILIQLYPIARRPMYRYLFSSAEVAVSVMVAMLVTHTGAGLGQAVGFTAGGSLDAVGTLTVAAVAYFVTEVVAIAGVIWLSTPKPTLSMLVGSRRDNVFAALTLCLAALLVFAASHTPLAPLFLVPLLCAGDWSIRQLERLRGDARTDHKTDLLNTRGWQEQANQHIAMARRQRGPVAVAIIDLDHFKHVNDTWGHPAGDAVLRTVAAVLREQVRQGDVVGRFGGEEFVLMLPDTQLDQAYVVAERVRKGVAEMHVAATDKRGQPVLISNRTASIGIAAHDEALADLDSLLQSADSALYEAKNGGRNQVRLSGPVAPLTQS